MARNLIVSAIFCTTINIIVGQVPDIGNNPRIFESNLLPLSGLMATVGNGHIATVVYSDTIYMNGLYNGERGESHRARIPSYINVRVQSPGIVPRRYALDTEKGIFTENLEILGVQIAQTTFAHRLHTSLFVIQITADFSQTALESITFNLTRNTGPDSGDITFTPPRDFSLGAGKEQNGTTNIVEDARYQPYPTPIYVIYSDVADSVTLTKQAPVVTFLMSMANTYEEASQSYLQALFWIESDLPLEILQTHVDQWASIWSAGNIYMEGPNLELAKVVAGSLYYLMSSLPYQEDESSRQRFYGLSPGSLARGGLLADYQGHSFWDTETWMYPPILMLWPRVAKDLLLYRMANVGPARDRANASGFKGIRFPWESGFTGVEVTPDCCPETRDNQQHITGDVAFATRQYWAVTEDYSWLFGEKYGFPLDINGCDFIRGMAEFWASRATYNSATDQYEINGVMPPDEDHPFVNNSIFTNVIASYSILFAKKIECVCLLNGSMSSGIPDEWLDIARKLKVPFDPQIQFHPEFDGYVIGDSIKQADVVLLGYPISFVTNPVERKNDLEIYENVTRPTGPAMTWGMHAIGYIELGDEARAESLFNRSYKAYRTEPFKVWTEAQVGLGAINFITGMGGFLQAVMSGYAGLRIQEDYLSCDPKLPYGITNLTIQGVDYLSCSFDISINEDLVRLTWTGDSCSSLMIVPGINHPNMITRPLKSGRGSVEQERKPFIIRRMDVNLCNLSK